MRQEKVSRMEAVFLESRPKRVEISFSLHQRIEGPFFRDTAVPKHQDAVIPAQQAFIQRMGDNDTGDPGQIQDIAGNLLVS